MQCKEQRIDQLSYCMKGIGEELPHLPAAAMQSTAIETFYFKTIIITKYNNDVVYHCNRN
jgi:hypothetical protein